MKPSLRICIAYFVITLLLFNICVSVYADSTVISTTNYPVSCTINKVINVDLSASNLSDLSHREFKVIYNPDQLELVDLCSFTPENDTAAGYIEDTNITVSENSLGTIVCNVYKSLNAGEKFTGVVNIIKFKAKVNGTSVITYTVYSDTCEHLWSWTAHQAASCIVDRLDKRECSLCGREEYRCAAGTAAGHDWGSATCTTPDTCVDCGETAGDTADHNWTAATCTSPAACSVCSVPGSAALGHNWGNWSVVINPSCYNIGIQSRECLCSGCSAQQTKMVLPFGHDFTAATCTASSSCTHCSATGAPALGHNYGSWKLTTSSTCTEPAIETRYCSRPGCNATETRNLPALGHLFTCYWVDISTENACENYVKDCIRCPYQETTYYDTTHWYSGCADSGCNDCSYTRIAPGHSFTNMNDYTCNNCNFQCMHTNPSEQWANVSTLEQCRRMYLHCNSCGYDYYTSTYDDLHSFTDQNDHTCNDCGYYCDHDPIINHYWDDIGTSGVCQVYIGICSCGLEFIAAYDYTHIYTDCVDTTCNDCGFVRVPPDHSFYDGWVDVSTSGTCEAYVRRCHNCSYYDELSYDYTHFYTDCADASCNDCAYSRTAPGHSFYYVWEDVGTSSVCEKLMEGCHNCSHYVFVQNDYTHAYTDCTDPLCNDCGFSRTPPNHSYYYQWEDVSTSGTCERYVKRCNNCDYYYVEMYDYTHNYTDCADASCNECAYSRAAPGHSYYSQWENVSTAGTCRKFVRRCYNCSYYSVLDYDYNHIYFDCVDSTCNKCSYSRTPPNHSYYFVWEDVCTSGTCERYVKKCYNCGFYSIISYDYTHAYTDCADSVCNDCSYVRAAPGHSYYYRWEDVCTSSICEKYVKRCYGCSYYQLVTTDYTHAYTDVYDRSCNDCGYLRW